MCLPLLPASRSTNFYIVPVSRFWRRPGESGQASNVILVQYRSSKSESRPISRVLSWAIIHLGLLSPASSSDLPEDTAGRDIVFLFGLAPGGVFHAANCYQLRGALLPHHFTLTRPREGTGRYIFCCTFRRLAPPRYYLAPCPVEPGLSSFPPEAGTRLPGRLSGILSIKKGPGNSTSLKLNPEISTAIPAQAWMTVLR